MSPSTTYSITHIAVEGPLVFPCSIILHAKVPKGVLMVLWVSSSRGTRIGKYQLDRSIDDRYLALATVSENHGLIGNSARVLDCDIISGYYSAIFKVSGILALICMSLGANLSEY